MKRPTVDTPALLANAALAVALVALPCTSAASSAPLLGVGERKCARSLGKAAARFAARVAREHARCHDADIAGRAVGTCPNSRNLAKIARGAQRITETVGRRCTSRCSISGSSCLGPHLCQPLDDTRESCSGGIEAFDIRRLGFPGPFCPSVIGGPIVDAEDLGSCVTSLLDSSAQQLVALLYGSLDNSAALSRDARTCLSAISKNGRRLVTRITRGVVKCRDAINAGRVVANPAFCTSDDADLSATIADAIAKLAGGIANGCSDESIQELDLCGNGVGVTASVTQAQTCLSDALVEIAGHTGVATPLL